MEERVRLDFFENTDQSVERVFVEEFPQTAEWIRPEYLVETPYRELLISVARGDGRMLGIFRRARLHESTGGALVDELVRSGVLRVESSRERRPERLYPGQPIRKELRGYRIQPKVRFVHPFFRFWFGFVEPFRKELERGRGDRFVENYRQHRDRALSLVFEQLSNELLELDFSQRDPLVSKGSYWDRHSEFDLLCRTTGGRLILGECKYTGRPVCRGELKKLREKAVHSGIRPDLFALFSRSGFSRELRESGESDVLLFSLKDFERLLY